MRGKAPGPSPSDAKEQRRWRSEHGSMTLETAVLVPGVLALVGLVVLGARVASAHQVVAQAAEDAARAATLARTQAGATAAAAQAASADLSGPVVCKPWSAGVSGTLTPGATLVARVSCTTTLGILPGTYAISASAGSVVDTLRGVGR